MMRDAKDRRFIKVLADDLHTDGHAFAVEAAGQREGGQAREVDRDRVDIRKIHLQRVLSFLANVKCGCWCGRRDDHVAAFEGGVKVALDQSADALRFQIIGVVISRR